MAGLDKKIISEYNRTRGNTDKSVLCHAPFTSINFEQTGKATACCYNRKHVLGTYPQDTVKQMWYGAQANDLRNYIRDNNLEEGCRMCKLQLESANYAGFKAKLYDQYASGISHQANSFLKKILGSQKLEMPKVMEFELENTCNLECIMCNGDFSSSIRKNREKRPALQSPYNKGFVDQLVEFMPSLTDMKFLGGEPFMIDIYYDIWDQVVQVNPNIKIHITTNATMLNSRTKKLLEGMKAGINVSIDSVNKETYEKIRVGASFERVMDNVNWLIDYTQRKNMYIWFSICPMVINRYEMPDIIEFANERKIGIFFNTVWWPEEQSLRFMSYDQLDELIRYYESRLPQRRTNIEKINFDYFIGFINQLKFWKTEKEIPGTAESIPDRLAECLSKIDPTKRTDKSDLTKDILLASAIAINPDSKQYISSDSEMDTIDPQNLRDHLKKISSNHNTELFLKAYFDCLDWIASEYFSSEQYLDFQKKVSIILSATDKMQEKTLLVSDLIRSGVLYQVNYIANTDIKEIEKTVKGHYN